MKNSSLLNLHGAEFIYTEQELFYNPKESPWANISEKTVLNQLNDIVPQKGLPMFCKDFSVNEVSSAKINLTALGVIEVYVNGIKIGEKDRLKPGFCSFNKRALSFEYDITDALTNGNNRILAVCSRGWYSGRIAGDYYGANPPAVMICLDYFDKDGEHLVVTDESWKSTIGGRVVFADIWDGEYYDATVESYEQISKSDFDTLSWENAKICNYFDGEVSPFIGETVRVRNELTLKPVEINVFNSINDNGTEFGEIVVDYSSTEFPITLKKGQKAVVDFGQNAAGRTAIMVSGQKGTVVKQRYSEMLNDSGSKSRGNDGPKGSVYTINMRSAKAKSYCVLNGEDKFTYKPEFTFFGFRYVEISADKDIVLHKCDFEIIGSATKETGKIETSCSLLNKFISNVIWGQRSNYLYVPTDCPQRDERLGWTGDTQAFSRTAAYNADIRGFMHKWLQDMRDAQGKDGGFSDVVPRVMCCQTENASAWGDAGIIVPYNIYLMFGDTSIIAEHYEAMEKYIDCIIRNYGYSGAIPRYGDWLAYDRCKNEFVSSAYFVHDLDLMVEMSKAIGKAEKAKYYKSEREKAHKYFCDNFMADGELIEKTQANYVLALCFDLLSDDYKAKATNELIVKIKENGNKLSTGFVGTYLLCPTLSKMGEDNMAYTLLLQKNEPSWLYSVLQGATTIWERWNSYTLKNGFGNVGMNSFNHYAYGAVMEWMYRYMAGIETDGYGFENLLLAPRIDTRTPDEIPEDQEKITWVKASYDSVKGLIESEWNCEKDFTYKCTVPEGITATLLLPLFGENIIINGEAHLATEFEKQGNAAVVKLDAGKFEFICKRTISD